VSDRSIERWGESFDLADRIGLMPLMRFAHLARSGVDSDDMEGLDAMYTLLNQCFTDESWTRFQDVSTRERADGEELFACVTQALTAMTARPTGRPSDSSDGSPNMSVNSAGGSSSQVIARLEAKGRPDLALIVTQAEESRRSA
jgi:hypothetical protein